MKAKKFFDLLRAYPDWNVDITVENKDTGNLIDIEDIVPDERNGNLIITLKDKPRKVTVEDKLDAYFRSYAKDVGCTVEEAKEEIKHEWGKEGLRGYGIFSNGVDFDGVKCICRIDEMDIYDGDLEAAKQAEKDGIKLIPWSEQPKKYPFKHYRFLDTPENRIALNRELNRLTDEGYYN